MRFVRASIAVVLFSLALSAAADVFYDVPIVTQVQGATFYRTSLAISDVGPASFLAITFVYRSPVDNTMQYPVIGRSLASGAVFESDDIVELMKTNSDMRNVDRNQALFGTLFIELPSVTDATDVSIVARTYSPGPNGTGTMGIAYLGRPINAVNRAFSRLTTTVRNGTFGHDGSSRANIGMVNYSNNPIDLKLEYKDATTGVTLKSFNLSSVTGRLLETREVVQLNNIFADPLVAGASRVLVTITMIQPAQTFSGYAVQLDNTTNDGSFFLLTEK